MRKYIFLLIALCLQIAARGQTIVTLDDFDLSWVPQPTQAKALRYWFDDDAATVQTTSLLAGSHTIDVAALMDGLHTLHYQVIDSKDAVAYASSGVFLKMNTLATTAPTGLRSLRYWFDDDGAASVKTLASATGIHTLDVSSLMDGLHTLHCQVVDTDGNVAYASSGVFLKMNTLATTAPTGLRSLRYWFDNDGAAGVKTLASATGIHTLDVSSLMDGLHTLHCQVVDTDGNVAYASSGVFLKMNNISTAAAVTASKLLYWFDNETAFQTVDMTGGVQMLDVSQLMDGLHTLHYQVVCSDNQLTASVSSVFLKMNMAADAATTAQNMRYWFDEEQTATTVEIADGVQMLDASRLMDGLHTVHYQIVDSKNQVGAPASAVFLKMNMAADAATTARTLRYWYDTEQTATTVEITEGVQMLDAARLMDGLHTIHYQIVDSKNQVGAPASAVFLKMNMAAATTTAQSLRYWFDNDASTVKTIDVSGGTQTLDVSDLLPGLHTLNYQLTDSEGRLTAPVTRIFVKNFERLLPEGENRITAYQYWLNTNSQAMQTVELNAAANPYTLITLLPLQKEPIHSDCFHFEMTNGVPTIYAKNILHVRFHDAQGYFSDGEKPFVDYSVKQEVEPVDELQATQTFPKVTENDIRWYTMQVAPGDTAAFRLSQAATLQVFAPSGKEVFKTSESASVQWGGIHTWEDGTYYVAVHDVTGSQNNMTLDYMHMDKYDVVEWDVHTVGNGGCSTITFKGNGFRDLYAVDLYTADGDTIHSVDISHDSDAETAVTFDFSGAELGVYDAVFHFTQEDKRFANIVTVEEAKEIDIETEVQYASSYLRGTKNPYRITLTNVGNMTAYDVPVIIGAFEENDGALNYIKVDGYSLSKMYDEVWKDSLPTALYDSLRYSTLEHGDMCYFIKVDNNMNGNGFPFAKYTSMFPSIPPYSSLHLTISIKSSQTAMLYVWVANPNQIETTAQMVKVKKAPSKLWCEQRKKQLAECIAEVNRKYADDVTKDAYTTQCEFRYGVPPSCPGDGGTSNPQPPSDPNDIYGYLSEAGSKFIADTVANVNYTIEFENDTAFAQVSAHTIVIRDTLDSRYFDLKSFLPTSVKIGERETFLDEAADVKTAGGVTSFLKTIDMRPEINAIAQVEGEYSQQTGIAKWTFSSLDPMTMEPTDDLMQGILPVNYNGTSGIGEVMFEVGVKPNKADGTQIPNRAGIVFDYEEPILTPTWTNIVDATAPESHVTDVKMLNDSTATVSIEATDELSGPWRYNVYVQYGSGAWFLGAENVPIDTTASVKVYEGINHGFYVVVTDSAGNVEQKQAAREFTFDVFGSQVETNTQIELAQGWNWISHNQQEPLPVDALKPASSRMMGQTEEVIEDSNFGWMGDLEELLPTQMYKIQMDGPLNVQLSGLLFNAAFRSIPLYEGWNWIGYPVANTMTPTEALQKLEAEEGDMLIGQDGLATYSEGEWVGTLLEMVPGLGYMYRSVSDKNLFYNATAQASARAEKLLKPKRQGMPLPEDWTVDKRKYPNVMGMIAVLMQDDTAVEAGEWIVGAFSNGECRGLSTDVSGVLMMNVYGQGGEPIVFYAMNIETGEVQPVAESESFQANVLGSMQMPYTLHIGEALGVSDNIREMMANDGSVYDLQGRKVDGTQMKKGIYVTTDKNRKKTQKVIRR